MARNKTYRNPGTPVTFGFPGYTVRVGAGESYSTSDEEEQTAVRKAGFEEVKTSKKKD